MATYVLVHGSGRGGWCYQPFARRLRGAGHEVRTPTLTGLGERSHLPSPQVDLDLHIQDVVAMEQARSAGRLWSIDTGHDLLIIESVAVTNALVEVAGDAGQ
ncbi:hypothetical protein FrEUN1fDRAFT_2609 [Parafrankia sp. EUN1f]|nr:hypothetical protein [Parafrankia sp. EUN1f]EFC84309.1 hypothetical protein FrEUN1fDRAFT_2609 [Parafrankia sp. EUN1f]